MSVTINIIATKHNRNKDNELVDTFWYLEEEIPEDFDIYNYLLNDTVSDTWVETNIPKKWLDILEKAPVNTGDWCLKTAKFLLTLNEKPDATEYGKIEFDNIIKLEIL